MSNCYSGSVNLKLLRHGKGQYNYPNKAFRFDGRWSDGCKNGEGKFMVEGGSTFEGHFVDGEIEGHGKKTWPDGRRYEGYFSRGEASGEGVFSSPTTGETYVGTWSSNRRHGEGHLVLPHRQGTYVGGFDGHRFHGKGRLVLASGFQYTGDFSLGHPSGFGSATYPGGSTFSGPFEAGLKNGVGGKYACGITGISFVGEWKDGRVVLPPSIWAVEVCNAAASKSGSDNDNSAKPNTGGKGSKKGKGAAKRKSAMMGAKRQANEEEDEEGGGRETPVVVAFDSDGKVSDLWCRCVRNTQDIGDVKNHPQILEDDGGNPRRKLWPPREVVSTESGRTLAVTLHQITPETSPMELGSPSTFFVRRPDVTDVSERLERFPTDRLVAHFPLDKRCWPEGCDGRLRIISRSPSDASGEDGIEDGALEAQWQTILGDLGSNRCLMLGAGRDLSLTASNVFAIDRTSGNAAGNEQVDIQEGQGGNGSGVKEPLNKGRIDQASTELLQTDQSHPVTVCIDYRLDLDMDTLACDNKKSESNICSGREQHSPEKNVRIVAFGEDLEVWVLLRSSTPPPPEDIIPDVGTTETPSAEKKQAVDAPPLFKLPGASAKATPCSTWYLHSISARAGSRTITVLCVQSDSERNQQNRSFGTGYEGILGVERDENEEKGEDDDEKKQGGKREYKAGGEVVYDATAWHSIALAYDPKCGESVLCLDGDVFPLHANDDAIPAAERFSPCNASESFVNGENTVVIGGAGGMWTTLAVKNLAVYSVALDNRHVVAVTRVFRRWRKEEDIAAAKEEKEEDFWLEEACQAKKEERRAEERPEWIAGATRTTTITKKLVRGEAKLVGIILPKAALEGGEWALRVEDVSVACTAEKLPEADIEEERAIFPPLPGETIMLEQALG